MSGEQLAQVQGVTASDSSDGSSDPSGSDGALPSTARSDSEPLDQANSGGSDDFSDPTSTPAELLADDASAEEYPLLSDANQEPLTLETEPSVELDEPLAEEDVTEAQLEENDEHTLAEEAAESDAPDLDEPATEEALAGTQDEPETTTAEEPEESPGDVQEQMHASAQDVDATASSDSAIPEKVAHTEAEPALESDSRSDAEPSDANAASPPQVASASTSPDERTAKLLEAADNAAANGKTKEFVASLSPEDRELLRRELAAGKTMSEQDAKANEERIVRMEKAIEDITDPSLREQIDDPTVRAAANYLAFIGGLESIAGLLQFGSAETKEVGSTLSTSISFGEAVSEPVQKFLAEEVGWNIWGQNFEGAETPLDEKIASGVQISGTTTDAAEIANDVRTKTVGTDQQGFSADTNVGRVAKSVQSAAAAANAYGSFNSASEQITQGEGTVAAGYAAQVVANSAESIYRAREVRTGLESAGKVADVAGAAGDLASAGTRFAQYRSLHNRLDDSLSQFDKSTRRHVEVLNSRINERQAIQRRWRLSQEGSELYRELQDASPSPAAARSP